MNFKHCSAQNISSWWIVFYPNCLTVMNYFQSIVTKVTLIHFKINEFYSIEQIYAHCRNNMDEKILLIQTKVVGKSKERQTKLKNIYLAGLNKFYHSIANCSKRLGAKLLLVKLILAHIYPCDSNISSVIEMVLKSKHSKV